MATGIRRLPIRNRSHRIARLSGPILPPPREVLSISALLLTGQSVPIPLSARIGRSNAIAVLFARCDPVRPDLHCGISQAVFQASLPWIDGSTAYHGLSCRLGLQELPRNSAGPRTEGKVWTTCSS